MEALFVPTDVGDPELNRRMLNDLRQKLTRTQPGDNDALVGPVA
jgi:hypothetical protein